MSNSHATETGLRRKLEDVESRLRDAEREISSMRTDIRLCEIDRKSRQDFMDTAITFMPIVAVILIIVALAARAAGAP